MAIDTKNERLALVDLWEDPDGEINTVSERESLMDLWIQDIESFGPSQSQSKGLSIRSSISIS